MTPEKVHNLGVLILVVILAINELKYVSRRVAANSKARLHKAHVSKGG